MNLSETQKGKTSTIHNQMSYCGGKSLNSYIGPQALFANGNASEEEQTTRKVLE